MKTSELTGPALDWAVAKCEGFRVELDHQYTEDRNFTGWWQCGPGHWQPLCGYSTDWSQGGPIIERESIDLMKVGITQWRADCGPAVTGPTPLIAAMRAFVTKKFGVEIEIPEELA